MNLYALDRDFLPIFADQASKQTDYACPECRGIVRLRGGFHRQNHFYHVDFNRECKQAGKGMVHLQAQLFFLRQLPEGECTLEHRFAEIGRVTDVFWCPRKIVFEIQYSPIPIEEVEARNRDYASLGLQIVWILHEKQFNKWRVSAAEFALTDYPHYYTNINLQGQGMVYDQFSLIELGLRKQTLPPLPIRFWEPNLNHFMPTSQIPAFVKARCEKWKLSFGCDLIALAQEDPEHPYLLKTMEMETQNKVQKIPFLQKMGAWIQKWIFRPYQILFYYFLEKASR